MAAVFQCYSDEVLCYLRAVFSFDSGGRPLRFSGLQQRFDLHDVLAETFRRAFEQRARLAYDGISPYEIYLKRIARNLVIDRLRALRRTADDDPRAAARLAAAGPSPEQAAQEAECARLVRSFVASLAHDERRLVALRFQEDLGQEEVARRLGKTRRWVRTREARLRHRLVVFLRGTGYLPPGTGGWRR
jgi:RNA polymerase sigma-70 factor (ECF subfamily)